MVRYVIWDREDKLVKLVDDRYGTVLPYTTSAVDARTLVATLERVLGYPGFTPVHYDLADENDRKGWSITLSTADVLMRWSEGKFELI